MHDAVKCTPSVECPMKLININIISGMCLERSLKLHGLRTFEEYSAWLLTPVIVLLNVFYFNLNFVTIDHCNPTSMSTSLS